MNVSAGGRKTPLGRRLAVCRSLILVRTASSCFTANASRKVWGAKQKGGRRDLRCNDLCKTARELGVSICRIINIVALFAGDGYSSRSGAVADCGGFRVRAGQQW